MIVASIDIGTNTIILLIAEMKGGRISPLYNEQQIPRIGRGLMPGELISDEKKEILMDILADYKSKIEKFNSRKNIIIATNAFRIASNGTKIARQIKEKFDINVKIVSGDEEAKLSYLGAVSSLSSNRPAVVIDIGGGSSELIFGIGKEIIFKRSFQVGVVSASEKFFLHEPPLQDEINKFRENLIHIFSEATDQTFTPETAIAIAGTPTTLACIMKDLPEFDENAIEGSFLSREDLRKLIEELSLLTSNDILVKFKSVVKGRQDVLLAGTIILYELMNLIKLDTVMVSTKGIRYGALLEYAVKD